MGFPPAGMDLQEQEHCAVGSACAGVDSDSEHRVGSCSTAPGKDVRIALVL